MAATRSDNDVHDRFRDMVAGAERIVAMTGAGISTESGIPDFRGPGGLWTRIKPITYQEFVASEEARLEDWRRRFRMNEDFAAAEPNQGHAGLARLWREGRLAGLITQNIDGLHQRAGLPDEAVIEIHGNSTHGRCLDCGSPMAMEEARRQIDLSASAPRCACGGLAKAAVVSFGERMPEEKMHRAAELAISCDLFLVIGSSLMVQPAASLPLVARSRDIPLVILNREPTPLDGEAELVLRTGIGVAFQQLFPQSLN